MSNSLQPHGLEYTRISHPLLSPGVYSNSCQLNWWCYPANSSSASPFPFCLQSFRTWGSLPMNRFFHQVVKVVELQLQHQSFQWIFRVDFLQDWLVWSSCSPRDSQESSPAPQFKSINSSVLSLLYGPTLISIHDYWKNHSFWLFRTFLEKWCLCFLIHGLDLS